MANPPGKKTSGEVSRFAANQQGSLLAAACLQPSSLFPCPAAERLSRLSHSALSGRSPARRHSRLTEENTAMQLGMIGLGRMGGNMVVRLSRAGHQVVGYARDPQNVARVIKESEG